MSTAIDDRASPPGLRQRASAAIYDRVNAGLEQKVLAGRRRELLQAADGRVLEVGAGTGASLPHDPVERLSSVVLVDSDRGMLARAGRRAETLGLSVELREASAERLPFADASFDTVVFTLSLCTIPDPGRALREAHRVLRPGARLLVLEHVRAQDPDLARWQDRLTPVWRVIGGGCHPNRDTRANVEAAGFVFEEVEEAPEARVPIPIVRPFLQGVARTRPVPAGGERPGDRAQ